MNRAEALACVRLLHAYARGTIAEGTEAEPSIEERAWAAALEAECPGATRADGQVGVRKAACAPAGYRITIADVVRRTHEATAERYRGASVEPARALPAWTTSGLAVSGAAMRAMERLREMRRAGVEITDEVAQAVLRGEMGR